MQCTCMFNTTVLSRLINLVPSDLFLLGGYEDRSELAEAVKEVVKCLSSRAVRPSSLRLTLRMLELERVHSVLSYQCLSSIADRKEI